MLTGAVQTTVDEEQRMKFTNLLMPQRILSQEVNAIRKKAVEKKGSTTCSLLSSRDPKEKRIFEFLLKEGLRPVDLPAELKGRPLPN